MPTGALRRQQEQQPSPQQHVHQHAAPRPDPTASSRPLNAAERDLDLPDLVNLKVCCNRLLPRLAEHVQHDESSSARPTESACSQLRAGTNSWGGQLTHRKLMIKLAS